MGVVFDQVLVVLDVGDELFYRKKVKVALLGVALLLLKESFDCQVNLLQFRQNFETFFELFSCDQLKARCFKLALNLLLCIPQKLNKHTSVISFRR